MKMKSLIEDQVKNLIDRDSFEECCKFFCDRQAGFFDKHFLAA
jgi:hypothetical protein